MSNIAPEMATLKARLKATWMAGDYAHFAAPMEPGALEFLRRIAIAPGSAVLDVGCGAGQIAIPLARTSARVTGIDIAGNLVEHARLRAHQECLSVRFDEGDAESLPYADASFDVVVSLIGAMFAPRPDQVVAELVRVCRPGGRIVMANWTAEGFVGQLFKAIAQHLPPSSLMPSPMLWGNETIVRERFHDRVATLQLTRRMYPFDYPFGAADVVEFYRRYYGPANRAFAALAADQQAALRNDLERLWARHNRATDGTMRYEGEYLEVIATRP